jgi:hypothetical protein
VLLNSVKSNQVTKLDIPVKHKSVTVYDLVNCSEAELAKDGSIEVGEFSGKFVIVNF